VHVHRLERRVANAERRAFGGGCCPHLAPLVRHENDWHRPARQGVQEPPCWCGRPRLVIVVSHVRDWRALEEPDGEP
jgi:hypothetical protein